MHKEIKKKAIRRLRIIEGQLRGLQKMVDEEKYCIDVLNQSSAVKNAISQVEDLILENHLSSHVIEQVKSGEAEKAVHEILQVYKLSKRK